MKKIKRIIIVDLLYLGDLLFAHPFFKGLRELFPEARIDLVANSNFAEIMRVNSNLDHVYSYNKNWTAVRSYKFAKKLKMNNYQLGINIHGNWRTTLLLKFIEAEINIGYGGKGRGIFLDEELESTISSHMIEFYLDCLKQLQESQLLKKYLKADQLKPVRNENEFPVLKPDNPCQQRAANKLKNIGLTDKYITLNTGGSWKTKRWPEEYFAKIALGLQKEGHNVLFVGGPSDTKRVNYILNKIESKNKIYNLSGQTSLLELAAVLKKSDLLISGDTGPTHVAAAVGTNTLAIFGPSDEEKYAPRGSGKNVLIKNADLKCRPCGEHECPLEHFKCMKELKPKKVVDRIKTEGLI